MALCPTFYLHAPFQNAALRGAFHINHQNPNPNQSMFQAQTQHEHRQQACSHTADHFNPHISHGCLAEPLGDGLPPGVNRKGTSEVSFTKAPQALLPECPKPHQTQGPPQQASRGICAPSQSMPWVLSGPRQKSVAKLHGCSLRSLEGQPLLSTWSFVVMSSSADSQQPCSKLPQSQVQCACTVGCITAHPAATTPAPPRKSREKEEGKKGHSVAACHSRSNLPQSTAEAML